MGSEIKLGIVGLRRIADVQLRALAKVSGLALTAAYDMNLTKYEKLP